MHDYQPALIPSRFDAYLLDGLEGAKWLALLLMAACHFGMAMGGGEPAFLIGRVCAPTFCFVIVARLFEKPEERSIRYLIRLAAWSVPAQLPFSLWTAPFGFHFNVLATLALGVGAIWIWIKGHRVLAAILSGALLIPAGMFDMGLIAPPIMLLGYALHRRSPSLAATAISAGYATAHLYARPHDLVAPALCMLTPVMIAACGTLSRPVRLPGWVFYAFYPAHIGLAFLLFGPCPVPK